MEESVNATIRQYLLADPPRHFRRVRLKGKMNLMAVGAKRYSAELKRDAVAMVAELVTQGSAEWAAMTKAADLLGVTSAETVRQWVRKTPTAVSAAAVDTGEEIRRLRKENAELKRANGILKAASAFFAAEIDRPHR